MLQNEWIQRKFSKNVFGKAQPLHKPNPNWGGGIHPSPDPTSLGGAFGASFLTAKDASHSTPPKVKSCIRSLFSHDFSWLSVDWAVRHTAERAICLKHIIDQMSSYFCNKQPLALYAHCGAHCINLIVQTACESVPFVRDALAVVQELGSLFSISSNVRVTFRLIAQQTENSGQFTRKLKPLCPTRWLVRVNAITTLLQQYSVVMQSIKEIGQSNSHVATRARGLYKTLVTGTTAFGLLMSLLILRPLEEMNKALQSRYSRLQ